MGAPLPHGSTAQMRLRCIARLDRSDGPHRRSSARPTDLVANFTANPVNYTIALSASPSAGGTVSGSGTFTAGTPHTPLRRQPTAATRSPTGPTTARWFSIAASYTFTLQQPQLCGELPPTRARAPLPQPADLNTKVAMAPTKSKVPICSEGPATVPDKCARLCAASSAGMLLGSPTGKGTPAKAAFAMPNCFASARMSSGLRVRDMTRLTAGLSDTN